MGRRSMGRPTLRTAGILDRRARPDASETQAAQPLPRESSRAMRHTAAATHQSAGHTADRTADPSTAVPRRDAAGRLGDRRKPEE